MQPVSKISKRSRQANSAIQRDQLRRALIVNAVQFLLAINIGAVLFMSLGWENINTYSYPIVSLFGAFLFFWFWTLHRTLNKRLQWYDVCISTALDFALCMELLLFQYASSDGTLGAAPLFSYVFLMIAMRCLHFQPGYVWLAGFFATITWGTIVYVSFVTNGLNQLVPISFGANEFLLSGITERFIAILGVTWVLAYTVKESKRYFEAAIVRALAEQGLAKFIGSEIANTIVMADGDLKPGQGRMARAAIIMIDIRNFSQTASTMKPSAVMHLLQEYQSMMVPIIIDRGGIIDKFMGDGILAHFGAVNSSSTYAADALVSIEEILFKSEHWQQQRLENKKPPIDIRAACAIGDVVFGTVGGGGRMEFTIIGDAVNTTAKLEKHTKKMGVKALVTSRAFETARAQGYIAQSRVERHSNQKVSGISRTVDLVAISQPEGASFAHLLPKNTRAS